MKVLISKKLKIKNVIYLIKKNFFNKTRLSQNELTIFYKTTFCQLYIFLIICVINFCEPIIYSSLKIGG